MTLKGFKDVHNTIQWLKAKLGNTYPQLHTLLLRQYAVAEIPSLKPKENCYGPSVKKIEQQQERHHWPKIKSLLTERN